MSSATNPTYRVVHLERNQQQEVEGLPSVSRISMLRLWSKDCFVYVVGTTIHIYDFVKRRMRHTLKGHAEEVIAIDASDADAIASLSTDGVVKLWSGEDGRCRQTLFVPEANFFLGYPYCLHLHGNKILGSSDEGAFLLEFENA
eukprot:TRINITY_DN12070_c0_g1_i2.p1 TRINITY_DN12070_c0_g1~~TRINITY_DN12070_c0_g1_i2.p1  ORF type:complete len:144 (-),score=30.12 TRINITY_DN12070_c0_g1_i2:44-475(-)